MLTRGKRVFLFFLALAGIIVACAYMAHRMAQPKTVTLPFPMVSNPEGSPEYRAAQREERYQAAVKVCNGAFLNMTGEGDYKTTAALANRCFRYPFPPNDIVDDSNDTPLNLAAALGLSDKVAIEMKRGANIETRNKYGRTPLLNAVIYRTGDSLNLEDPGVIRMRNGQLKVVKMLLAAKVDTTTKGSDGKTAFEIAEGYDDREMQVALAGIDMPTLEPPTP